MSGPARKKIGDQPAYWVDDVAVQDNAKAQLILDRILTGLPALKEDAEAIALMRRVLDAYDRNLAQLENDVDYSEVMRRRESLLLDIPNFLDRIVDVINDGQAPKTLSSAYEALAASFVELQQNPPIGYSEGKEYARDAAICSLMDIAETRNIPREKIALHSQLIEYKTEDQFKKAVNRAVNKFSGHNK